jgi:acetate kinase
MTLAILALNAGSSSIKFSLFTAANAANGAEKLCQGEISGIGQIHGAARFSATDNYGMTLDDRALPGAPSHEDALAFLLGWLPQRYATYELAAVGHRIVHGGPLYLGPVLVDAQVLAELRRLIPLAPLHQPHHIAAIEAMRVLHPTLPQVACFDTSFHQTQQAVVTSFALPHALTAEGIRRYGFHGLSYEYIASTLPGIIGDTLAGGKVVVAHLGAGASMCALDGGKSVATTMSFTPLDGLPMSRRCGALDPGVVLYLMQEKGMSAEAISALLYHESGLFGMSGISDDMQVLLASAEPRAAEAIDLFVYRINRELGSLAAALGGLDALILTAGIGEHAVEVRARICRAASWIGLDLDPAANAEGRACITRDGSKVSGWVIPTDEDLMIVRHTQQVLANSLPT